MVINISVQYGGGLYMTIKVTIIYTVDPMP